MKCGCVRSAIQSPRSVIGPGLAVLLGLSLAGCTLSVGPNDARNASVARENASSTSMTLKRLLEADDAQVRALVAKELGEIGPSAIDAVPTLHRLTEDSDRHVRLEAARALMRIDPNDRVAVPALVMIINDPVTTLDDRLTALTLLQQSGPKGQAALAMHNASGGSMQNPSRALSPTTMPVRNAPTFIDPGNPTRNEIIKEEPVRATDVPAGSSSNLAPASSPNPGRTTDQTDTRASEPQTNAARIAEPIATGHQDNVSAQALTQTIPGLAGLDAAKPAPPPDIHLYGTRSYSSHQANRVREWIEQKPGLSESEKNARLQDFHRWRSEQDRRISEQALQQ